MCFDDGKHENLVRKAEITMNLFTDCGDCLCQLLMCFGCCYLCKKCCGCDDPPRQQMTHQTIVVQQPVGAQYAQPMYDPNQGQWQQQQVYYPTQQGYATQETTTVYYPDHQQGYAPQQPYPMQMPQPGFQPQAPGYPMPQPGFNPGYPPQQQFGGYPPK